MHPLAHPSGDAVGPDHAGAHHRLGHGRQGLTDPGAHHVVGPELPALEHPQQWQQRRHHHDRDDGELPRVDGHHRERAEDDDRVDDPRHTAPLGEAGDRLHVAGDPGGELAPLRFVVVGDAQPVDVGEGLDPEVAQHLLGGLHEADVGRPAERHHHERDHQRDHAGPEHEAGLEPLRPADPLVEDLLDQHRRDEATDGGGDGHADGEDDAAAQLGADREATTQHLHGPHRRRFVLLGEQLGLVVEHGRAGVGEPGLERSLLLLIADELVDRGVRTAAEQAHASASPVVPAVS